MVQRWSIKVIFLFGMRSNGAYDMEAYDIRKVLGFFL